MRDDLFSIPHTEGVEYFKFDFSLPFFEAIKELKSPKGVKMRKDTHAYHVLCDLFNGKVIDDYNNAPKDLNDRVIRNVPQRVFDLQNTYQVKIDSRTAENSKVTEYFIDRGGM